MQRMIDYSTAIALFLMLTEDEYNVELASKISEFPYGEPIKNFINFNEASLVLYCLGNIKLAQVSRDISVLEKTRIDWIKTRYIDYAFSESGVRFYKERFIDKEDESDGKEKYIYILEFDNNSVKIGITKNQKKRMNQIVSQSGLSITRSYFTEKTKNAIKIESELHKHFKEKRLNGEFFSNSYEEAISELKKRINKIDK